MFAAWPSREGALSTSFATQLCEGPRKRLCGFSENLDPSIKAVTMTVRGSLRWKPTPRAFWVSHYPNSAKGVEERIRMSARG